MLVGPLRFTPVNDEWRRGYAFEGVIALDRLLAAVVDLPTKVASPSIPSWNQIAEFLESMRRLRDSTGFAA